MNLFSFSILFFLIMVVVFGQRRWAAIGMIAGALYLTQGAKIEIFGINLFAMRFLELAGFVRIMARKEFSFSKLNKIDKAFLWLYFYTTVVFMLRSNEGLAYQIGITADAVLCYFTFRGLIKNTEDFRWFLHTLSILLVPYVALLIMEALTYRNPFFFVGGLPTAFGFRKGWPRCLGSFRNPDLLGTLGASFLPLYIGLAFFERDRNYAFLGIILCLAIVWLTNSGGPASAAAIALAGWFLWGFRTKTSMIRRGILALVLLLDLAMKAPIWYLPAKLSSIVGGHGWHRSYLMDIAFKNIDKWWLAGMPIKETADWFPYILRATGGADITNQYIGFGITAGIVSLFLLIFLLIQAYKGIGNALIISRLGQSKLKEAEPLIWGLGVTLSVHAVNWLGVSYFDQVYVFWFMQLATVSMFFQESRKNLSSDRR